MMNALELKIPPPVVAVVLGFGMWGLSRAVPAIAARGTAATAAAMALSLLGIGLAIAGEVAFHGAKTTVNPFKPGNSSSIVTGGVYRFSRNPMYVGLLFQLLAWAIYLLNPWTLVGPAAFALYITRFQIVPEERALSALFGEQYAAYMGRVRRWL